MRLPGSKCWQDVMPVPGALIINAGDLVGHFTNNRWPSVWHRVIASGVDGRKNDRLSIVTFTGPSYSSTVDVVPTCVGEGKAYEPINTGEHFRLRLESSNVLPEDLADDISR